MEFSLVIISSEDTVELSGKIKVFSLLILKGFILLISSFFSFSDNLYEFLTLFYFFLNFFVNINCNRAKSLQFSILLSSFSLF